MARNFTLLRDRSLSSLARKGHFTLWGLRWRWGIETVSLSLVGHLSAPLPRLGGLGCGSASCRSSADTYLLWASQGKFAEVFLAGISFRAMELYMAIEKNTMLIRWIRV
jgi:hypothetical protein